MLIKMKCERTKNSKEIKKQGCGAVMKMTQLRLRSSSFHKHGSSSGALFFSQHGSGSSSGFCSFLHINIFNSFGVPQVEWKMQYIR